MNTETQSPRPVGSSAGLDDGKHQCPHCHGSLTRYEDPEAVKIISRLEADIYERQQWLNNAERILRDLGYERCTAGACNCSSYHRRESANDQAHARPAKGNTE